MHIQKSQNMQGIKDYQEKLFLSFRLSERVPKGIFYRRLKGYCPILELKPQTIKNKNNTKQQNQKTSKQKYNKQKENVLNSLK